MLAQVLPRFRTQFVLPKTQPASFADQKKRFKKLKKLGTGFFGVGYSAVLDGKPVVIKVVTKPQYAFMKSLRREARILRRLQKFPFVPRLVEVGSDYLIMEDVGGESLQARASRKKLTAEDALAAAVSVGIMASLMNNEGVAHSDLKSDNVLLTPNGVVIIDFGVSWEKGGEDPLITMAGVRDWYTAMAKDIEFILGYIGTVIDTRKVPDNIRQMILAIEKKYIDVLNKAFVDENTARDLANDLTFALAQLGARARRGKTMKPEYVFDI